MWSYHSYTCFSFYMSFRYTGCAFVSKALCLCYANDECIQMFCTYQVQVEPKKETAFCILWRNWQPEGIYIWYMYKYINVLCINKQKYKYIQSWPKISAPFVKMTKGGCENVSALLILLICFFYHKKSNLSLNSKNLKWGEISLWNKCFSQIHIGQLLAPLEILISKISILSIFPIHIHNFEHSSVIMNMKLSNHGFLFHRSINRRQNKAQIPLIINHNKKNQRIYFWCSAKDNWASQISDVALRIELDQRKFPFPPSGQ